MTMQGNYLARRSAALQAHVAGGLPPGEVARLYGFPKVTVTAPRAPVIALIELGGGDDAASIAALFAQWNLPAPAFTEVLLDGATNAYTNDPNSADAEVVLDIVCAAGAYAYMTETPAQILRVFAPNTLQGFVAAAQYVSGRTDVAACGISWGSPEDTWTADLLRAMDAALASHVIYCVAAGDAGSGDGEKGDHADYPGSSPHVICCGGTSIVLGTDAQGVTRITNQVPWNANGGATGGGFSAVEAAPAWQVPVIPAGHKRGVPDLCALADPAVGYATPFGPVGGTSAVAPLMAGYFAALVASGLSLADLGARLYAAEPTFTDITAGNNGDEMAGTGWDAASGLGAPNGDALHAALAGGPVVRPTVPVKAPVKETAIQAFLDEVEAGLRRML